MDISSIIGRVQEDDRKFVTEWESKQILRSYGVPVTQEYLCSTAEEAVARAGQIGYPVVMKLVSPQVVHKTEFDAVKLNLTDESQVEEAFVDLVDVVETEGFSMHGVLVSEMTSGVEMIIGSMKDPQFGPMLMFGLGGIFVEAFQDVTYRIAPIERIDALEMIEELEGSRLIKGFRNRPGVDIEALVNVMISVSRLMVEYDIEEMDLNPIFGNEDGVKVADARIFIE